MKNKTTSIHEIMNDHIQKWLINVREVKVKNITLGQLSDLEEDLIHYFRQYMETTEELGLRPRLRL